MSLPLTKRASFHSCDSGTVAERSAHTEPYVPTRTPAWAPAEWAFLGWGGEIQGAADAGTLAWIHGPSFSPESQYAAPGRTLGFSLSQSLVLTLGCGYRDNCQ